MVRTLTQGEKELISTCQLSTIELSRQLGFSTSTIRNFAKKTNLILPRGKRPSRKYHVILGKEYGFLTPIDKVYVEGRLRYSCRCRCGQITVRAPRSLFLIRTPNCGCYMTQIHYTRRLGNGKASSHVIFLNYKANANKRNLEWGLSEEEFVQITTRNCFYCKSVPTNSVRRGNSATPFVYSGVDRKDNTMGYTIDNSVPCCKRCNIAKANMTIVEFTNWIRSVYNNLC